MKRVFAALSAVLVMLSVTACGDKESEGSSSKRSSAESLSGTYRVADIDGFGDSESGPIKRLIEFSDDGRFEMFLYNDDLSDKEYYKEYGCICNETGSYDVSDGEISLTFDPINTKEELIEQYPSCLDNRYRETGDTEGEEEYYENTIKNVKDRRVEQQSIKYGIAEDNNLFYQIDAPHRFRKGAYNGVSQTIREAIGRDNDAISEMVEAYSDNIDKYSFFSSDDELNENVSNEAKENFKEYFEKVANEKAASWSQDTSRTAEEGFTRNFDISKHSWLMVTRGNNIYAFVVGESIDSDIFGSSGTFLRYENPNSPASQLGKEITDNFHSIRDVYNYYKSLD